MKLTQPLNIVTCLTLLLNCANIIATYHVLIPNNYSKPVDYVLEKDEGNGWQKFASGTVKPNQQDTSPAVKNSATVRIKARSRHALGNWEVEVAPAYPGADFCNTSSGCYFRIQGDTSPNVRSELR